MESAVAADTMAENDDPLGLKELSVKYDYLMYKIQDSIATLSDQTYQAVVAKQDAVNKGYLNDQLQVETKIQQIDRLMAYCDELEGEFMKLEQLEMFITDFNERIAYLEKEFSEYL